MRCGGFFVFVWWCWLVSFFKLKTFSTKCIIFVEAQRRVKRLWKTTQLMRGKGKCFGKWAVFGGETGNKFVLKFPAHSICLSTKIFLCDNFFSYLGS